MKLAHITLFVAMLFVGELGVTAVATGAGKNAKQHATNPRTKSQPFAISETAAKSLGKLGVRIRSDVTTESVFYHWPPAKDEFERASWIAVYFVGKEMTDKVFIKEVLPTLKRIPKIRELNFEETKIGDETIAGLKSFSHLRILRLNRTAITNKALAHCSHLTRLETLELSGTKVTDKGIPYLIRLSRLETLELAGADISDKSANDLAQLSSLRVLDLNRTTIGDRTLNRLRRLKRLKWLGLCNTAVTDRGVLAFNTDQVGTLDLRGTRVTAKARLKLSETDSWRGSGSVLSGRHYSPLKQDWAIRRLVKSGLRFRSNFSFICYQPYSDRPWPADGWKTARNIDVAVVRKSMTTRQFHALIDDLKQISMLRSLSLRNTKISSDVLRILPTFWELEYLDLSGISLQNRAHVSEFKSLPFLITLDLSRTEISDEVMTMIGNMPQLRWLYLGGNPKITDAGIAKLAALKHLKVLDLSGTSISDAGLRHLTGMKDLHRFVVKNTKLTNDGLYDLRQRTELITE